MLLLDPKLVAPDLTDTFTDNVIDPSYEEYLSDGTAAEAGGTFNFTLPDAAGYRGEGWLVSAPLGCARVRISVPTHVLAAYVDGAQSVTLAFVVDDDNYDAIICGRDADGDKLAVRSVRAGVMSLLYSGAIPPTFLKFEISRFAERTEFAWRDASDVRTVIHTATTALLSGGARAWLGIESYQTGAMDVRWDDLVIEPDFEIEAVSDLVYGCHLKNRIRIYGRGFLTGLAADLDGQACVVVVDDENNATLTGPLFDAPGTRTLTVGGLEIKLTYSATGYRILRSLLAQGRYTTNPTDPFNVRLAALGQGFDRIDAAAHALYETEIFPDRALQTLATWEQILGIPTVAYDSIADRRARVTAHYRAEPRITTAYLNSLIDPILPGVELYGETDYATYGVLIFNGYVYEPTLDALSSNSWALLTALLNAAGPAWSEIMVGNEGFYAGASRVGRDFV